MKKEESNLLRMSLLERKIKNFRGLLALTPVCNSNYGRYKIKLDEYILEYQERQLIQDQMEKNRR